jgi:hypothetical protein
MCGIVHGRMLNKGEDVRGEIAKTYFKQRGRGTEGFGFVALMHGKIVEYARAESEQAIMAKMKTTPCDEMMFHHRYPTSTPNFAVAAHPIEVKNKALAHDYYMVHNGVLWNDDELREQHLKDGFKYTTEMTQEWKTKRGRKVQVETKFNDSEALAIELARDIDNEAEGIPQVKGSVAFIILQVEKATKNPVALYWGRNSGSPLVMGREGDKAFMISSEGGGEIVPVDRLYRYDYASGDTLAKKYPIGPQVYASNELFNVRKNQDIDIEDPAFPKEEVYSEDENNKIGELCIEWDELQATMNSAEVLPAEEEDSIYKRLLEIDRELDELQLKHYQSKLLNG